MADMKCKPSYIGKIDGSGAQYIEAPVKCGKSPKCKKYTGSDLRCGKSKG